MIKVTYKPNCSGCYACATACPQNCIQMNRDNDGFSYPIVDTKKMC